ncbi:hypothetical protein PLICRDRAFT_70827, partial [Plicaturopsis crispa FD-325 SS-3]
LLTKTLTMELSDEEATDALYGPLYPADGEMLTIYTSSVMHGSGRGDSTAAFGVYWGAGSPHNDGYLVDGAQTDARAAIMSILYVVATAPANRPLTIYSNSEYAIRSFCYWAGRNSMEGWRCRHGDVLRCATAFMRNRKGRITFNAVKDRTRNGHYLAAHALAKQTA